MAGVSFPGYVSFAVSRWWQASESGGSCVVPNKDSACRDRDIMGQEIVIEVMDEPALGSGIEVDQTLQPKIMSTPHQVLVCRPAVQPLNRHRVRAWLEESSPFSYHEVLFANLWGHVANSIRHDTPTNRHGCHG